MSEARGTTGVWIGRGTTSIVPPVDYWAYLAGKLPGQQLEKLRLLSNERLSEFIPRALPPPENSAVELLDLVAADGWLERVKRQRCPSCDFELSLEQAALSVCPECNEAYGQHGGVTTETIYIRHLAPTRDVDWVVAIHGMNTTGAWQEVFSWHLATTWGRSVPVAVYKYGIVIAGVIMAWRRRKLQRDLRAKLAALRNEAQAQGFFGKPDVIAHSFGTWLFGHLLESELKRMPEERLRFGRIILTGCVLRPDFDWKKIKDAGLVDDVLNHYGSKDSIVPMAHMTIWNSGPSGKRGFDGDQVLNVRAEGFGHSDLFSIEKCVVNGTCFQHCAGDAGELSHLEYAYKRYWRPFLTLPREELVGLPNRENPTATWRQLWWPLRGTMFPFVALPFILALMTLLVAGVGRGLWEARTIPAIVASVGVATLVLILVATATTSVWRRLRA